MIHNKIRSSTSKIVGVGAKELTSNSDKSSTRGHRVERKENEIDDDNTK
jgi:hypothetical protein